MNMIALALLLPLAQEPTTLTAEFRVLDSEERAVPGAWIVALARGGDGSVRVKARADDAGSARLDLPLDLWRRLLGVDVVAWADGVGFGGVELPLRAAVRGGSHSVRLVPGTEAVLQVQPPHADLDVEWRSGEFGQAYAHELNGMPFPTRTRTDGSGVARLLCPSSARLAFAVTTPAGVEVDARGESPEPIAVKLPEAAPPGALELTLVADDPAVVRARTVRVFARSFDRVVVTDDQGRATVDPIPAGKLSLTLEVGPDDPPYLPESSGRRRDRMYPNPDGEVVSGERLALDVALVKTEAATGTLRGPGGFEPVSGATLRVSLVGSVQTRVTAADGGFTFLDPRVGGEGQGDPALSVVEAPPGWRTRSGTPGITSSGPIAPPAGEPWHVEVARTRSFSGRVVDAAGEPLAGAWLRASWQYTRWDGNIVHGGWEGVSDGAGRFRVSDVVASELELRGEAGDLASAARFATSAPTGAVLTLGAPARGLLSLRVVDPRGAGIPGVAVAVSEDRATLWSGRTDASGAVEAQGLDVDSSYGVELGGDVALRAMRRDLRTGADPVVIVARPAGALRGRVVDSNGAPVPGARVRHASDQVEVVSTDERGRFELARVDRFCALVTVRADGFRAGGMVAAPDAEDVEIRLARADETTPAPAAWTDPLDAGTRRRWAASFLDAWTRRDAEVDDPLLRAKLIESWVGVDPARAAALLESFEWPDPLIEARLFLSVVPAGPGPDPRWELARSLRDETWSAVPDDLARIDGHERRLAFLIHAWWRASDPDVRAVLLESSLEPLAALEGRAVAARDDPARRYREWRPSGVVELVEAWTETVAQRDHEAARALVRGWRSFHVNPPRRWEEPPIPDDGPALRAGLERDRNLDQFPLVARWVERGGWTRASALDMFAAALRDRLGRYDVPHALALLPLVARDDAVLARELMWRLLDEVEPLPAHGFLLSGLGDRARIALAVGATDPELGRRLFESELALVEQVLARGLDETRTHELSSIADWLRMYAPDPLESLLTGEVTDDHPLESCRRLVDALALEGDELFAHLVDRARTFGRPRPFDPDRFGVSTHGLRASARGTR